MSTEEAPTEPTENELQDQIMKGTTEDTEDG